MYPRVSGLDYLIFKWKLHRLSLFYFIVASVPVFVLNVLNALVICDHKITECFIVNKFPCNKQLP